MKNTPTPWKMVERMHVFAIVAASGRDVCCFPKHYDDAAGIPCGSTLSQDTSNEQIKETAMFVIESANVYR